MITNFITIQSDTKELACFFNDMAAFDCLITAGEIYAYAPSNNDLVPANYTLYIYSIRSKFRISNPA